MKSIFTISAALLLSGAVSAQITLTNALGPKPGDVSITQNCNVSFADMGASGANITVNVPSLVDDGAAVTTNYISPTSTTYASSFPGATVASPIESMGGISGYAYYKTSATKTEILGVGTPDYVLSYPNAMEMFNFPTSYLTEYRDTFTRTYTVGTITLNGTGNVYVIADAWGTITTPAGTFPYLRLNVVQEIVDSMFMDGTFIQTIASQTYTYNYMTSTSSTPVLSCSEVYSDGGNATSGYYGKGIGATGLKEAVVRLEDAGMYPNPASTNVNVKFNLKKSGNVSVRIFDITGKEVYTNQYAGLKTGKYQFPIDIESMPAGIYSATIQADEAQQVMKFIVE